MEITATYPVQYNLPNIEYQKTVVKVNHDNQITIVYTYDKNGNLIESVVRSNDILGIS